ncbi:MAG: MFS transporter [Deltaproteobacteria bacterium]|jgi:UMF1 family MFS transporter|nr:MFS transporter [Deltaproteobacteria bacterium]
MSRTYNKKTLSWVLYDWANSSFSTTVMAGFFPLFFKTYWSQGFSSVETTSKLGTTIGISSFLIAILSPIFGTIADLKHLKKFFLVFFMFVGVLSCASLGIIGQGKWLLAMIFYGLGMMSFNASNTFYDSLLPYVAEEKDLDFISALGYSLGYLGGGLLFLLNVVMYLNPEFFGFSSGTEAVKFSFLSVAMWWFLFSIPLIIYVKEPSLNLKPKQSWGGLAKKSFLMLKATLSDIVSDKNLFFFMMAFWLYIDGVYTVIVMAVDYGISLNFEPKHLIGALLITQFIGFPCTYLFGYFAKKWGCRLPILICIGIYCLAIIFATQMKTPIHFYLLAIIIGMAQGGIQSLSRSMFSKMIPKEKSGEYFGFMNLIGKFASVLGPFIVALTVLFTGKSELGLLGLVVLFGLGAFLLIKVREP